MEFLTIGKRIHSLLEGVIGEGKVYPLIAEENATYPFIVYKRDSIDTESSKDRIWRVDSTVTVTVAATTYKQAVNLGESVITTLRNNFYIDKVSASERFESDAYVEEVTFNILEQEQ